MLVDRRVLFDERVDVRDTDEQSNIAVRQPSAHSIWSRSLRCAVVDRRPKQIAQIRTSPSAACRLAVGFDLFYLIEHGRLKVRLKAVFDHRLPGTLVEVELTIRLSNWHCYLR